MRIEASGRGIELIREPGDKPLRRESEVTYHIRRLLNARDGKGWTRCWPYKIGLTSCRQGVWNRKLDIAYWHERYQVEDAGLEFNSGRVFFAVA